eukprot:1157778-Pelagomonas_calceolata.AAC.11
MLNSVETGGVLSPNTKPRTTTHAPSCVPAVVKPAAMVTLAPAPALAPGWGVRPYNWAAALTHASPCALGAACFLVPSWGCMIPHAQLGLHSRSLVVRKLAH